MMCIRKSGNTHKAHILSNKLRNGATPSVAPLHNGTILPYQLIYDSNIAPLEVP